MKNRWSDSEAEALVSRYGRDYSRELILRSYSGRLLGSEKSLVLHGGGNTSLKGEHPSVHGESCRALFIKASGFDLATIEPEDHVAVDMGRLESVAISTATWSSGSIVARSNPDALMNNALQDSPWTLGCSPFREVLPPPCKTSDFSEPNSRPE
jgi:rhamnose utilization protein RhaD (predicted bifunctional aldolase and dehydrogenase)